MAHKYTKAQAEFIRENVVGIGNVELTEMFNRHFNLDLNVSQIKGYKKNNNLSSGLDGRFSKGHVPANKGTKGVIYEGCKNTWFKKGNRPVNHRSIGSERVNVEGYTEIKVAEPKKWKLKHRVIWEKHNGPIPKGYNVIFGDGDKSNLDINNLILVSKKQMLTLNRNNLIQNDADFTKTAVIIADLYNKIGERKSDKK